MSDRAYGAAILIGGIAGAIIYFWLAFLSPWQTLTIQASAFIAVAAILAVIAWIGYTLVTTPPPTPLSSYAERLDEEVEKTSEEAEEP